MSESCAMICIINMTKNRSGYEKDVEKLQKTCKIIDFQLYNDIVHSDLRKDEIKLLMKRFSKESTQIARIVIFMGHGNKTALVDGIGEEFDYNEYILKFFNSQKAEHLIETAKIFIFQACRGARSVLQNDDVRWISEYN